MTWLHQLHELFRHLDQTIQQFNQHYGAWTYGILSLIVFCETGLVVTPVLPGDSLLFVAGSLAKRGDLDMTWIFLCLSAAAILGDTVNYQIGHFLGPKVFHDDKARFFKKEHLLRTHAFYEKYGGKTIIVARFVPIIRTFAPFVAGIGAMSYPRFLAYNVIGAVFWVSSISYVGYLFGTLPFVRDNLEYVLVGIVVISCIPGVIEYLRQRRAAAAAART